MNEYISIGQAAKLIGISLSTMYRWEKLGKLRSTFRTFGQHRRYSHEPLPPKDGSFPCLLHW